MSDFAYPLHEECGVFGIYDRAGTEDVAAAAYSALYPSSMLSDFKIGVINAPVTLLPLSLIW